MWKFILWLICITLLVVAAMGYTIAGAVGGVCL
jgi:hypothetical protein